MERFITFGNFRNWMDCCRSGIFFKFNFLKSARWVSAAKFYFFTEALKIILFLKICKCLSFSSKNIQQQQKFENNFFLSFKDRHIVFDLVKAKLKNIWILFSFQKNYRRHCVLNKIFYKVKKQH